MYRALLLSSLSTPHCDPGTSERANSSLAELRSAWVAPLYIWFTSPRQGANVHTVHYVAVATACGSTTKHARTITAQESTVAFHRRPARHAFITSMYVLPWTHTPTSWWQRQTDRCAECASTESVLPLFKPVHTNTHSSLLSSHSCFRARVCIRTIPHAHTQSYARVIPQPKPLSPFTLYVTRRPLST